MKSFIFTLMVILLSLLCLAQTPVSRGPAGKMDPSPEPPDFYPHQSYDPPPMQLVPAGEYDLGDSLGTGHYDEVPVHAVYIDAFYMDIFEVTNEEYCAYLNAALTQGLIEVSGGVVYKKNGTEPYCDTTVYSPYTRIEWDGSVFSVVAGKEDHPVVKVSWYGAAAYANWRSAQVGLSPCYDLATWDCALSAGGFRLPTEAEWEKAARGGEHNPYHDFPWGDSIDGSKANYSGSGDPYEGAWPDTTPVGYYDGNQTPAGVDMANGYGLYDMAGNVWEWCNDWYDDTYYQYCVDNGVYFNPEGPSSSPYNIRALRGGSWGYSGNYLRCAFRGYNAPGYRPYYFVGFRLVKD